MKDDQAVFKDLTVTGCKFYVNTRSPAFIPTSLWELKQNLPNTIFDDLPPDLLMALMKETADLNFIMEPIDIYANIGDINSQQFFFSLVGGKVNVNLTPGTVANLNRLIEYQENFKLAYDLKMYRPQRRPCSESMLAPKYQGKDVQELPEAIRRKRKLLVRDWFYYVVWYVRLRKLVRNFHSEQLLRSRLEMEPKRFKEMIAASQGGIQAMREFLAKEHRQREKAVAEKNTMAEGFRPSNYQFARVVLKFEQLNIQIHEKEEQVGKKPPLYDFASVQPSYETRLELGKRKLQNHFGARQISLRQLHTLDGDLQTSAPLPPSKQKQTHAGPSSILGSILKNEPRMIRPNPGGISTRGANPTPLLNMSLQPGMGSSPGSTRYGGRNTNLSRGARGLSGLDGGPGAALSVTSTDVANTVYTMAKKSSPHVASQQHLPRPAAQQPAPHAGKDESEESTQPPSSSLLGGLFSSLMGSKVGAALRQVQPPQASLV